MHPHRGHAVLQNGSREEVELGSGDNGRPPNKNQKLRLPPRKSETLKVFPGIKETLLRPELAVAVSWGEIQQLILGKFPLVSQRG